jgi:spoIIIJ-associated protein
MLIRPLHIDKEILMEWVETTGKSLEEARERILDQLGVSEEDVEFEIVEQPKSGLFGLMRGEARVRGRVRPTEVRPKQERKRGRGRGASSSSATADSSAAEDSMTDAVSEESTSRPPRKSSPRKSSASKGSPKSAEKSERIPKVNVADRDDVDDRPPVDPELVGQAAVAFVAGVVESFGRTAQVDMHVDGEEIEIQANGEDLGLLVGPGGRTLLALQDLTRVVAQRRLGDHLTRLRVDVAGYRERRNAALQKFVTQVANQVIETGSPRSLEAMPSSDRKVVHDVLGTIDGVTSRSEGEDPYRRVVILPA